MSGASFLVFPANAGIACRTGALPLLEFPVSAGLTDCAL